MAKVTSDLLRVLRNTAKRLADSSEYQWGHMGLCNCGFLAQEVTALSKSEIHRSAMERHGDWSEQLNDYCPTSGYAIDDIITHLVKFGFTISELQHLERLSNPEVLSRIPSGRGPLSHNCQSDAVLYLNTWADGLEEEWLQSVSLPEELKHTDALITAN